MQSAKSLLRDSHPDQEGTKGGQPGNFIFFDIQQIEKGTASENSWLMWKPWKLPCVFGIVDTDLA